MYKNFVILYIFSYCVIYQCFKIYIMTIMLIDYKKYFIAVCSHNLYF